MPAEVKVLGYFTNFVLIAAVFGLGFGCLLAEYKRNTIFILPPYFLALVLLIYFLKGIIIAGPTGDALLLVGAEDVSTLNLYVALAVFYLMISVFFIPFGQITGKLFNSLPPLQAYSINILGALLGVTFFFILSYNAAPSFIWFIVGIILLCYYFYNRKTTFLVALICFSLIVWLVFLMSKGSIWSPYNKITTAQMKMRKKPPKIVLDYVKKDRSEKLSNLPFEIGLNVFIGNVFYQYILDLSDESVSQRAYLKPFQNQYNYPYTLASSLNDVLIVGAGTGNDVAGALRFGAKHIDAVEIDPSLVKIGERLHPEKPYSKPQVSVYIDDARSFMKKSKKNYDLIIFGQLDSHQIFSSMSNVRLDSYVYTKESFSEVKRLLKDNGIVIVSFALGTKVLVERMYAIMQQSFDRVGISFPNQLHPTGVQFLAGKNYYPTLAKGDVYVHLILDQQNPVPISTDDWPFFYVTQKAIPFEYLIFIGLAILISLSMVFPIIKGEKWDFHFLFLGSGFMLLETKSITSLALLYGSTWIVNSVVIAFILLMILIANVFVIYFKPQNHNLFYGLLLVSLIISYFVPINFFLKLSFWPKLLLSSIFFSCPILMAGLIFAISFRDNKQSNLALAFNLIGIVVGGLSEYTVLVAGFRYLIILTMTLYFASYVFSLKQKAAI